MAKKKDFTGDPGGLIGDAMFSVIKPIYKEGEKLKREANRPTPKRTYYAPEPRVSQKEIVFYVLPRGIRAAGSNFSTRDLYYATRPLAYAHGDWPTGKELKYSYFAQTLLTEYQEVEGLIPGMWRDPRGSLHEPHTGKSIGLGTIEVANYAFPEYTFDKILYVEKEGEWPKLQAAKLAERYDMAIASSKGYPVEAVRELFAQAEGGEYQLFVFHDADIDGYEIVRVLGEATRRMPEHNVDVLDIGLKVADAFEMGLPPEPYFRKGGVPATLRWRLTPLEREYFSGKYGHRFELNAILPDTSRIAYIERKLAEKGVRGKVIPPDDKLPDLAGKIYQEKAEGWVDDAPEEVISLTDIKDAVAKEFKEKFKLENSRRYIEARHKKDLSLSWRAGLRSVLEDIHDKHTDALRKAVEEKVRESLAGSDADED
jgi:hypothetical protein